MRFKKISIGSTLVLGLLSGCDSQAAASSEEIVNNIIQSDKENEKIEYHGIASLQTVIGGKETENITLEEFVSDNGKRKIITTDHNNYDHKSFSYNTGEQLVIYEEDAKKAQSIDLTNTEFPASITYKEQVTNLLNTVKDSHTYEIIGEEKILGKDTYHLQATTNSKSGLLGDLELWVDKKTWFILKSISNSGDVRSILEYKEIDYSPQFSSHTFMVDVPEHVVISPLNMENQGESGSLKEAFQALGKPFLTFHTNDLNIQQIEWNNYDGFLERTEVTVYYEQNNFPTLTLSIFPTPKENDISLNEGEWHVRGQHAEFMEEIGSLTWDEDGLRYTLMIVNPELTVEEAVKLADTMSYEK